MLSLRHRQFSGGCLGATVPVFTWTVFNSQCDTEELLPVLARLDLCFHGGPWEWSQWRAMMGDGGFVVLSVWPLCCYFCGMYTNIHTVSYNVFLTDCVHTHRYVWTRNVRSVSGWVSTINIQSIWEVYWGNRKKTFSFASLCFFCTFCSLDLVSDFLGN